MGYKELHDYSLSDILQMLEADNDVSDILLILQLSELNLLEEIKNKKAKKDILKKRGEAIILEDEDEDEDEDDLLAAPPKEARDKKIPNPDINRQKNQEMFLNKIQEIIESIKNRPQEFLGRDIHEKINKKIGFDLVPSAKDARSKLASKILIKLAKVKSKNLKIHEEAARTEAIQKIKKAIQEKNAGIG